ncbi:hypothetical protein PAXINDRAFT_165772 [Paxillus involutus ATCC 200175]|nr:hypothetical protein PAXINDRAFT_165772 [Paxillus involutus ATCC 200175]
MAPRIVLSCQLPTSLTTPGVTPTASSQGCTVDQALIDDDIAALHLSICSLRTRRNALSPISRLPPEILSTIFTHYARGYYEDTLSRAGWAVPLWVNVSYICRHWRDVALNCPSLWTFLFVSSPRWTEELFSRSKMAPLKIRIDMGYGKQTNEWKFLEKVAAHAERIKDLSLKLPCHEAEELLPKLSSRAPLLQTLHINVKRSGYLSDSPVVLHNLFNGHTPALRTLELSNCHLPWSSLALSGLTSLSLCELASPSQLTVVVLVAMLRHMPNLVYLHLENALISGQSTLATQSSLNSEDLDLPHLSRFAVIAPFSAVAAFLSRVKIPLKTAVRLRCRADNNYNKDYATLYPPLAKRFNVISETQAHLVPAIQTLVVESNSSRVCFVFSTSEYDYHRRPFSSLITSYEGYRLEDWSCDIPLKLDIDLGISAGVDVEGLIGGICRSVSLTHLRSAHLSVDVNTPLSSTFWKGTLGHLQELRLIQVTGDALEGLTSVLSLGRHHCSEHRDRTFESSAPVFAPSLAELGLYSVQFSEDCSPRASANPESCYSSALCLYDALSRRKAEGYGLQKIVVNNCMYVFQEHVSQWETVVDTVEWDRVTRTEEDYEDSDEEEEFEDEYYDGGYGGYDFYEGDYFDDFY